MMRIEFVDEFETHLSTKTPKALGYALPSHWLNNLSPNLLEAISCGVTVIYRPFGIRGPVRPWAASSLRWVRRKLVSSR
jgi:hypothetical protein